LHFQKTKALIGAILVFAGVELFLIGLQLEGWYRLVSLAGPPLVGWVFTDRVFKQWIIEA
jgi:hypothetical protein